MDAKAQEVDEDSSVRVSDMRGELENGRGNAHNNRSSEVMSTTRTPRDRQEPPPEPTATTEAYPTTASLRDEELVVDGDAVCEADVIDVDEWIDKKLPARDGVGNAGCSISEYTDEIDVDDCMNAKSGKQEGKNASYKANGEEEKQEDSPMKVHEDVPLSHYPDMDDVSGPKDRLSPSQVNNDGSNGNIDCADDDVGSSEFMLSIPEPISLRASSPSRQVSPGAFAISPSHQVNRSEQHDDDDDGTIQILSSPDERTNRSEIVTSPLQVQQDDMLVQATLVADGDAADPTIIFVDRDPSTLQLDDDRHESNNLIALVEAKPLDSFRETIRNKWTQFNILLVLALASTAIALGLLMLGGDDAMASQDTSTPETSNLRQPTPPNESESNETQTEAPTMTPLVHDDAVDTAQVDGAAPTETPTFMPTMRVPTLMPTMRPTAQESSTREDFYSLLPDYSVEAMKQVGSPQFKAFRWLNGDPFLTTYSLDQTMQRFALSTVLTAVGIDEQIINDSEMYGVHECDWGPLSLQCERQKLTAILLNNFALRGTLPRELGLLTSLRRIEMSGNSLSRTIPTTIGLISSLQVINLEQNAMSGTLPDYLSSLSHLEELNLSNNMFASTVPAELGFLARLKHLRLSHNAYTGQIPGLLRHLTMLETFLLDDNDLSGSLPDSFRQLTNLHDLALNLNRFSGTIPESWVDLDQLRRLSLADNMLTGTVPTTLGGLFNITRLELQGNSLEGTLPQEVCALQASFDLSETFVDCAEIICYCDCVCFEDQPDNQLP